jgi:hypothetical protein
VVVEETAVWELEWQDLGGMDHLDGMNHLIGHMVKPMLGLPCWLLACLLALPVHACACVPIYVSCQYVCMAMTGICGLCAF